MKYYSKILICFIISMFSSSLLADDRDAGRESIFLLGVSARALGLGNAYVSVVDDATSVYWNPAGLALLDKFEISFLHTFLFEETNYDFVSFGAPTLSWGSLGIGAIRLGTGDIPKRDASGQLLGSFENIQSEYILTYAHKLPLRSAVGMSLKILSTRLDNYSDEGFSGDIGVLFNPLEGLKLGVNFQDFANSGIKLKTTSENLPLNIKTGISWLQNHKNKTSTLLSYDFDKTSDKDFKHHFGTQVGLYDVLFLRGGYDFDYLTFGVGLNYNFLTVDYAFKNHRDLGITHRVSLSARFGKSIQVQRQERQARQMTRAKKELQEEFSRREEESLQNAELLFQQKKWEQALDEYYKVLALNPQNKIALEKIELVKEKLREKEFLTQQAERNKALIKENLHLAQLYLSEGKFSSAKDKINSALSLDTANVEARLLLQEADSLLREKISLLEREVEAAIASNNYSEAILKLTEILQSDPENQKAKMDLKGLSEKLNLALYLRQGIEYFNNGRYFSAQREFQKVLALDKTDKIALDFLQKARARTARVTTLEDLKKDPEAWKLYQDGLASYREGEYEIALEKWNQVLQIYPNNQNTLRNIERARQRLKVR